MQKLSSYTPSIKSDDVGADTKPTDHSTRTPDERAWYFTFGGRIEAHRKESEIRIMRGNATIHVRASDIDELIALLVLAKDAAV